VGRIRTIKPEFWKHEMLSALPEPTHILAAALLNYADDEGYFNANPGLIKAECSPLREPSVSIHDSLTSLQKIGYIRVGTSQDGRRYGHIVAFDDHQRINRPTPSKIKGLGITWEDSVRTHTQLTEDSLPEGNREQGTGNREASTAVAVPAVSPITPSMVASGILTESRLSGKETRISLEEVCAAEMKAGREPSGLRDEMVRSWQEYESARPKLAWTTGSAKFFGEGLWRNKAGWPWKEGHQPAEARKRVYANA
jgi:hypothetical protein